MKRIVLCLVAITLCVTSGLALAAGLASDSQQLQTAVTSVNQQAGQSDGQKTVITRLENQFNVDATRIDGLRAQNLGFGEIAVVLALAQKMTGGITDANVQSIMTMRTGTPPLGWGEIARTLGEKLGPVVSQVNAVSGRSHEGAPRAPSDRPSRPDRPDRPDPPDRPDRPERPLPPDHPQPPVLP